MTRPKGHLFNPITDRIIDETIARHQSGEKITDIANEHYVNRTLLSYRMKDERNYSMNSKRIVSHEEAMRPYTPDRSESEVDRKAQWDKIIYNPTLCYDASHCMPACSYVAKKMGCKIR